MKLSTTDLNHYLRQYEIYLSVERNLSHKSIRAYLSDLNRLVIWLDSHVLHEVTRDNLRKYLEQLTSEQTLKDSTIKRKYICFKAFFNYLVQNGNLKESPIDGYGKKFKTARRIPKTLSVNEIEKLLNAPKSI